MGKALEEKMEAQRLAYEKKATEERVAKELADKKIAEELAFKKKEEEKAAKEAAETSLLRLNRRLRSLLLKRKPRMITTAPLLLLPELKSQMKERRTRNSLPNKKLWMRKSMRK